MILAARGGDSADYAERFPLSFALETNGLDDTLWALRCLPKHDKLWRKYAVWCARQVQHLMQDQRSIDALDVAWRYSEGQATAGELDAVRDTAWAAARDAGWDAGWDAAWDAARKAQAAKLKQILDADEWVDD